MANRRMFSRNILELDNFYRMTPPAQILYVHLSMAADDEGFVGEMEKIRRQQKAKVDHIEMLIKEGLIYRFPGEIYLIMHWRCNNYIRRNRGSMSVHLALREQVYIRRDESYVVAPQGMSKADLDDWMVREKLRPLGEDFTLDKRQNDGEGQDRKETEEEKGSEGKPRRPGAPERQEVLEFFAQRNSVDGEMFFEIMEKSNWKELKGEGIENWRSYAERWNDIRSHARKRGLLE